MPQGVKLARNTPGKKRESVWTVLSPVERAGTRDSKSGVPKHGLDGLNASDGLPGEGEPERDSAQQFTADIHRAAAHTLQNTGFSEWPAAEPGEDDGLPWSEILENAEDLDLELFDAISLEDGFTDSSKAGADILNWEEILTGRQRG